MECIILSGGLGTRLGEISRSTPKGLLQVRGTPVLSHLLEDLLAQGFTKTILALGHLSEQIMSHFGRSYRDMLIEYSVEAEPLGTGGAIAKALDLVAEEFVFVINGDTLQEIDFRELHREYQKNTGVPILATRKVPDASRYGLIDTNGDTIVGFSEKKKAGPGMINAGCYVLPSNIFDGMESKAAFSFETDFLPNAVSARRFKAFELKTNFIDIGTPDSLRIAQDYEKA